MIQVLPRSIPIFPFLCSKAVLKRAPIAMSRAGSTTGHNPGKHFRESGIYCVTPAPSALLCLHLLTVTRKHSAISKPQLSTTSPVLALAGSIWLEISRNSKAQGDYKHNFASLSVKKKKGSGWQRDKGKAVYFICMAGPTSLHSLEPHPHQNSL